MPYKIVLHAPHGALDQVSAKDDGDLKQKLRDMIDETDFQNEDSITIFEVSKEEIEIDAMFDGIVADMKARG